MIMLENQISLFVLDLLLGIQLGNPEQTSTISSLVVRFFDRSCPPTHRCSAMTGPRWSRPLAPLRPRRCLTCCPT
jgi:hypothetical protein